MNDYFEIIIWHSNDVDYLLKCPIIAGNKIDNAINVKYDFMVSYVIK